MFGRDAAEGSDGTGKIVRLSFEGDDRVFIELDSPGVVREGRDDEGMADAGRRLREPPQQSETLPGCMAAVVAPALHEDFDLRVGMRPSLGQFVGLDDFHLGNRRVPGAGLREGFEFRVAEVTKRDNGDGLGVPGGPQRRDGLSGLAHPFYNFVIEESGCDFSRLRLTQTEKLIPLAEPRELETLFAECTGTGQDRRRFRVCHGGAGGGLHYGALGRGKGGAWSCGPVEGGYQGGGKSVATHFSLPPIDP